MNWKVFFKRTLSAIVFAVVMLGGLLIPDPFAIVVLAIFIQYLCLEEFFRLCENIFSGVTFSRIFRMGIQILALWALLGLVFFRSQLVMVLLPVPLLILLPNILSKKTLFKESLAALAGLLYIVLPMAALIILRNIHYSLALAVVLMIWMNDTMAYITGSFWGKTPFSAISPKKTWEGTVGGAILTLIGAAIWAYYSPFSSFIPFYVWIVFALFAAVIGTAGDLLESKLKRMAGVKDSGDLLPGHGGALDRFDSLLAVLPFALFLIALITW